MQGVGVGFELFLLRTEWVKSEHCEISSIWGVLEKTEYMKSSLAQLQDG